MNKKLLTLAVGAALAAGMSVAQAEVAVYGKAHVSIDMFDNDASNEETFISDNSSRIGVRVSEDLGGGLKGLAQWEMGATTDETNAVQTNRNSFIGLDGGFGTIRVGKYDTPYKDIGRKTDLFNERVGDTRNVIGAPVISTRWDARPQNAVRYDSPDFGGLKVSALYSADEGNTTSPLGIRYASLSASYQAGPLFAAVGYEDHNVLGTTIAPGVTVPGEENETGIRVGVGYKAGALTVNALYETIEDIFGVSGADQDTYGVGAAFKFGNMTAKAQYFTADDFADLMAVGLDYSFSKTVTGYVAYATVDNEPGASANVASSNGGHGEVLGTVAGGSPSAISVGMEMNF